MAFRLMTLLLCWCIGVVSADEEPAEASLLRQQLGGSDTAGYARAVAPRAFTFPADHGAHPDYRNEWWYLTGNLETDAGRRFGYQVTFFRIALAPASVSRPSHWAARQVWMAHLALSDAAHGRHYEQERFARGALGLAGAAAEPFRVWLEDWRLGALPGASEPTWRLAANTGEFSLDLELKSLNRKILQGQSGLSKKSAEPGNASYYYSLPRLATTGVIRIDGENHTVAGSSWLDREWSTSALADDQVGWDWFALQFDDGRDLMFYRLRRNDGSVDEHSAGTLTDVAGRTRPLTVDAVDLEPTRWWQAPDGVRYPVGWRIGLPDDTWYRVEAVFDDQRMDTTTVRYWEGMVDVFAGDSRSTVGRGYLELAGYD